MTRFFDTPALDIIDSPAAATHFTKGRAGHTPRFIVVHHTGGVDSLKWLTSTSPDRVSCHRLITKAGRIYKLVADEDTSHGAGYAVVGPVDPDANDPAGVAPNFNTISLNIELENLGTGKDPYPIMQVNMCAQQIVEWWGKYGFLAIVGHKDVDARKHDPAGFDWTALYRFIDHRYHALTTAGGLPVDARTRLERAVHELNTLLVGIP